VDHQLAECAHFLRRRRYRILRAPSPRRLLTRPCTRRRKS
jgi:hypothetical protein